VIGGYNSLFNRVVKILDGEVCFEKLPIFIGLGIRNHGKHIQVGTNPRTGEVEKRLYKSDVDGGG
jgi:hypothetical protein